ncbi:MAG: Glucose-6-phosphate 1-dehydrogenase [Chaenotheca gracillima]|nr:MAG: Glucose-6-phosphate 1-dehydrogenase [Chaenotheca gracillima]
MQPFISGGSRIPRPFICQACRSALPGAVLLQQIQSQRTPRAFSLLSSQLLQEKSARPRRETFRSRRQKRNQGPSVKQARSPENTPREQSQESQAQEEDPIARHYGYDPAAEFKARIEKLEGELAEMRTGGIFANKALMAKFSEQDRKRGLEAMNKERAEKAKSKPSKQEVASAEVKIVAPKEQRVYLNRLNGYLKQAKKGARDVKNRQQLWRWYVLCKQSVPAFTFRVPQDAWDVLWNAFGTVSTANPDRCNHLKVLANDLVSLGRDLTSAQRLAYIEALYLEGDHASAIKEWESNQEALGSTGDVWQEYWSMGVRMFANQNDPARAQETARILLDERGGTEIRMMIPVIKAWVRTGELSGFERAWALYIRLKDRLGEDITLDDYDEVTKSFLEAGRADLALGVFKDMMLTGDPSSELSSSRIYRKALGTISDMQDMTLGAPDTHNISLEAMTVLPRKFQNKFFYGSWIKKLIGAGEVDSAGAVVQLMYDRGVQPDPRHLNGIMGAWIRTGKAKALEKAEKMGWEMIERRKKLAVERRQTTRGEEPVQEPKKVEFKNLQYRSRYNTASAPPATIETFCVLIDYYLRRNNFDQIRWLNRSLSLSEIPPNTAFNNSILQSRLRSDGLREVWDTFSAWKKAYKPAPPDLETYELLWECEKVRLDKSPLSWLQTRPEAATTNTSSPESSAINTADESLAGPNQPLSFEARRALVRSVTGFPSPRALFADMNEWVSALPPSELEAYAEDFPRDIYHRIVESFVRDNADGASSGDLAGAIVAMHALKADFGLYPDEATARLIILQMSRNTGAGSGDSKDRAQPVRRRREGRYNIRQISGLLEQLAERRSRFLQEHGYQPPVSRSGSRLVDLVDERKGNSDLDYDTDRERSLKRRPRASRGPELDETLKKEENLYLISELLRTVLSRRLKSGNFDLDTAVQRAAWDMGVAGINTGDGLA